MFQITYGPTARAAAIAFAVVVVVPLEAADASIVQYAYTGTVGYGFDRAGIFGDDQSLTGKTFSLIERFDTAYNTYRFSGPFESLQFGGTTRGTPGSASLVVTIDGVSRSIADAEDYIYSGSVTGKHQDFVKNDAIGEYAGFYVQSPFMKADYGAAFTLDASQALFIGNYQFRTNIDPSHATYASFDVQSLTVGPVSAVPLPAGLALFGGSLVILGGLFPVLRRSRRAVP